MSLFRKVELIEEGMSKESPQKIEEKMDIIKGDVTDKNSDLRINENLIRIIENIVEKYLHNKTIKPKSKVKTIKIRPSLKIISKQKTKIQNGSGIKWIYK